MMEYAHTDDSVKDTICERKRRGIGLKETHLGQLGQMSAAGLLQEIPAEIDAGKSGPCVRELFGKETGPTPNLQDALSRLNSG